MKVGGNSTSEFSGSGSDSQFAAGCHNVIAIGYSLAVIGMGLSMAVLFVN